MTTFWWVRHGPTHQRAFTGWRDVPADLSDNAALDRLSEYLPASALIISSDLSRSAATADAIQAARTRLPHDPNLREMHFGDWDGLHFHDVSKQDPDLSRAFWEDPGDHAPPNGESWHQTEARVSEATDRLAKAYPGRDIIAVAHFGAILTQLGRTLNLPPKEIIARKIDNLSVTRLSLDGSYGPINHRP